ncbi:MAG: DUF2911 domain-containing protein [Longimicrobiales bacterium]
MTGLVLRGARSEWSRGAVIVIASIVALGGLASEACAQDPPRVRPSQRGTVSQTVDKTTITIVYDRPVARGRELFGSLVPWGRSWQPGANNATTIEFSDDVLVAGQPLPEGRYSLWAIPNPEEWMLMFSKKAEAWHTQYPGESEDALRVALKSSVGSHMETMAYYFPVVGPDSTILNFHWGTTIVEIPIRLRPPS